MFSIPRATLVSCNQSAQFRKLFSILAYCASCLITAASAHGAVVNPLLNGSIAGTYDAGTAYAMRYRLYLPPDLSTSTEKFPLVLFLHGAGERGTDNQAQVLNHITGLIHAVRSPDYEAFLLAPQLTDNPSAGGWNPNSPYDHTMQILNQVLQQYPIDTNRIYITGLSMGGYGTFTYLANFPNLFAAAVPMSGGGSTSWAPLIKNVPLWDFHGAMDDTVPVQNSRNMINALIAAGGSPKYNEIPNGGHNIWDVVYGDSVFQQYGLYDWMFSQTKAVPEPSSVVLAPSGALALAGFARRSMRRRDSQRQVRGHGGRRN